MYLIVVGAEPEGRRFVSMAVDQGHEVTLIEEDEQKARDILKSSDVRVLKASVADDNIFQEADIDRADAVVATTYDDAKNLMAMVLAKDYEVETRISLINQQSHNSIFEKLGVKAVEDPARIIANELYQHLL